MSKQCSPSETKPDRARALVDRHEGQIDAEERRDRGAHYTPVALADRLVTQGLEALGRVPRTVCDPSCGAGALLLAAADALHGAGISPAEIVERRLFGAEIDPETATAAIDALVSWAVDHGVAAGAVHPNVRTLDALGPERLDRGFGLEGFDLVVGNPPFLDQLDRRSSRDVARRALMVERFGAVAPYCDTAALFLLASLDLLVPGGVVSMLQPQSFLSARDTEEVRAELVRRGELLALWSTDEYLFDAQVRVCAPVVRKGRANGERMSTSGASAAGDQLELAWGLRQPERHRVVLPSPSDGWGALLAPAAALPVVAALHGEPLGTVASGTAGFRDEYYALCDAAVEHEPLGESERPRLVTVGMIDPWTNRWGRRDFRLGGRRWAAPALDVDVLSRASPRVGRWVAARRTPKVMVATQTRIIEAAVDPVGSDVPVTPLISIAPLEGEHGVSVWHLAAALSAPPVAATAVASRLGSGLSPRSVRWSASALLDLPLPVHRPAWDLAARSIERLHASEAPTESEIESFGQLMCDAHELIARVEVLEWWCAEVERRGADRTTPT